jgi:hypothetical protein
MALRCHMTPRAGELCKMLVEARKRKLSRALAAKQNPEGKGTG